MKNKLLIIPGFAILLFFGCNKKTIQCEIKTELGSIIVELYPQKAPGTVSNFLRYVDKQYYDSCTFFRTCTAENEANREFPIEVIQGGDLPESKRMASIAIETTRQTGLKHLDGTISMARDTPNSAQSDFFICIGEQPELDFGGKRNPDGQGFAAFGKVIQGMDVVRKIQALENKEQMLVKPVKIVSIVRKQVKVVLNNQAG